MTCARSHCRFHIILIESSVVKLKAEVLQNKTEKQQVEMWKELYPYAASNTDMFSQ